MANWEISLGGGWKPLGEDEQVFLNNLAREGKTTGELPIRGQSYAFDIRACTQTNTATKKSRKIRDNRPPPVPVPRAPTLQLQTNQTNGTSSPSSSPAGRVPDLVRAASAAVFSGTSTGAELDAAKVVQVWLAGEWKRLSADESREIVRRQDAGEVRFQIQSRGHSYNVDLDIMTQTNVATKRTRTIRFASETSDPAVGFDQFREQFHKSFPDNKLTKAGLQKTWPTAEAAAVEEKLVVQTVAKVFEEMALRKNPTVDIMEWSHYWALERDSPSFHAGKEVNDKLMGAMNQDRELLGRMQMQFETAVGETGSHGGLSYDGLLKACKRLVASPKNVIEKQWAKEVIDLVQKGEGPDEDAVLTYYDFLNVMLGRKKYPVELWMYDISDGVAKNWSWLLLGQSFEGIWHTGVVVNWPDKRSEFWFGGALFESEPGTTPFGEPMFKKSLGHTYKLRPEVWNIVARQLASEFTRETYDVLTHNCNHFSDKLGMFLLNEHIPDEVRKQPEMVMDTITAKALRPLLNRWLGGFESKEGRATDGGEAEKERWKDVLPGALIVFSKEEGGRPQVGQVTDLPYEDTCTVQCLDFFKGKPVELDIPRELVDTVVEKAPAGTVRHLPMGSDRLQQQQGRFSCW